MSSGADSEDLPLSRFVREITLPHRAKVREGYYEEGDDDGNREFSNGDIIDVRRIICPLVVLGYEDPVSQKEVRTSVTTRNPNVRFNVLTKKEMTAKPRHFRSVQELIDSWPLMVKCLSEQKVPVSADEKEPEFVTLQMEDELRLVRMIFDGKGGTFLECLLQRTMQLIQFQSTDPGSFVEVPDRMSYTLREIVDIAQVERNLRVDYSLENQRSLPSGLPSDYAGVVVMEKPKVFVEICRLFKDEDSEKYVLSTPILVPIDCDIQISPRHEDYTDIPNEPRRLVELGASPEHVFPVVARIVGWTEQSGILLHHVTRPGDNVMMYARTAIDRILAHCNEKYFLIPTTHSGRFLRVHGKSKKPTEIQLNSLCDDSFPFKVQYHGNNAYSNTRDDLPWPAVLTFTAFIKADPCVLVSKLFGDVIGEGFHLPLRTNVVVQLQRRVKNGAKSPTRMSMFDNCSEEISGSTYTELMVSSPYANASNKSNCTTERTIAAPPPVPSRDKKSVTPNEHQIQCRRPQPPTPNKKNLKNEDDDDDDHAYSYIDVAALDLERKASMLESTKHAGIVIPSDGNIAHFTVDEMLSFLKENSVPGRTISSWKKSGINGRAFAMMSDEDLAKHGIDTPIMKFFRDRSKMQINVLSQL